MRAREKDSVFKVKSLVNLEPNLSVDQYHQRWHYMVYNKTHKNNSVLH